ncbi:MAG: (2Fe-2S)-binding protein [Sulfuritalea sp.]|jgi:carbon-monoxide dehydrogenase small subunit|nr:(2Fe-2S)-binding protein [Sulfuritalea sp.]MBK9349066.1 (2Fe-2S)-binding protein [Sulfuritalea sp.]MBP6637930.1 (2Fe-2S)-binding protein [Sulfuritalea sp.]MBP7423536.1 (2Fe-2S)-binding protein [Sulfuritalea sp.]
MKNIELALVVNGRKEELSIPPNRTLLEMLREDLQLTGAKEGCGHGECGACMVILDGRTVNSCLILAAELEGASVVTIEGLKQGEQLHPVQQAFIDRSGMQCGFCTSGQVLAAKALLDEKPNPTPDEIRDGMAGSFCRCTGYTKIFDSVAAAAELLRAHRGEQP